jgi:hypothetical protein
MNSLCQSTFYQDLCDQGFGHVRAGEIFTLQLWTSLLHMPEEALLSLLKRWWEGTDANSQCTCNAQFDCANHTDAAVDKERSSFEQFLTTIRYEAPVFTNNSTMPKCYQCKRNVNVCQCLTLEQEQELQHDQLERERWDLENAEPCTRCGHHGCDGDGCDDYE